MDGDYRIYIGKKEDLMTMTNVKSPAVQSKIVNFSSPVSQTSKKLGERKRVAEMVVKPRKKTQIMEKILRIWIEYVPFIRSGIKQKKKGEEVCPDFIFRTNAFVWKDKNSFDFVVNDYLSAACSRQQS